MIIQGWKEFRALNCRRWVLVYYDVLWSLGYESKAADLLYRELRFHCNIPHEVLEEEFRDKS